MPAKSSKSKQADSMRDDVPSTVRHLTLLTASRGSWRGRAWRAAKYARCPSPEGMISVWLKRRVRVVS